MATPVKTDIPSLNGTFSEEEINISLTEAGLLPERTEILVRLYAEHHSWAEVKERWHTDRIHERGSRSSAQGIFRILKRRLDSGGELLPSISELHRLVEEGLTERSKAQLFYFYLIREDRLFRYVLHALLRRQGLNREEWRVSKDDIVPLLHHFQYDDESGLPYAESTLHRWAQGFRSVLRDIGVLKGRYDNQGSVPPLDFPAVHLGAFYSWKLEGKSWPRRPIGWTYLFQSPAHHEPLLDRIRASDLWSTSRLRDQTIIEPVDEGDVRTEK